LRGKDSVLAAKSFNVAAKRLYLALAEARRPPGSPRRPDRPASAYRRGASLLARADDHIPLFPIFLSAQREVDPQARSRSDWRVDCTRLRAINVTKGAVGSNLMLESRSSTLASIPNESSSIHWPCELSSHPTPRFRNRLPALARRWRVMRRHE
jgi:hypothetical protein